MWCFKKYKAIAYLPTTYTLLQYYLLEPYKAEDTLFFIQEDFPKEVADRLPVVKNTGPFFRYSNYFFSPIIRFYSFLNHKTPVYLGGELSLTSLFLECFDVCFYLEDGVGSYELVCNKERSVIQKREAGSGWLGRWLLGDLYPILGQAENVQTVYLTGILPIPETIAHKVELIDLKLLWQQKNLQQKENILQVFLPEGFDKDTLVGCETLLLTQPLSEDSGGRLSELEKIDIYRKLLSGYDESKVLIKIHPREKTDYSCYFPQAKILQTPCPMELLMLLGLQVKRAVSVNSTAIFNLGNSVEKIISGYDISPALAEEAKRRRIYEGISNRFSL